MPNWHNEVLREEGWFEMEKAETSEFGGFVYCTECYAVVGETDECLCLVEVSTSASARLDLEPDPREWAAKIIGCGREEESGGCCG